MNVITQYPRLIRLLLVLPAILLLVGGMFPAQAGLAQYVIAISIDGGGASYLQALIDQNLLPNFRRFQIEGAWTNNARNDHDITVTLPNHVSMVTGRAILGINHNGHLWSGNSDPSTTPTESNYSIQNNKGSYVYSLFDVAHDKGLSTALYASKSKFSLFRQSYNLNQGAPDRSSRVKGPNKIDTYYYHANSSRMTTEFINAMSDRPFNCVLVHYHDGDTAGHYYGWGSAEYNQALISIDGQLGRIFDLVTGTPALRGKTDIILTADHGGMGKNHSDSDELLNYRIPFYVWGPDTQAGADLYALNPTTRRNPGTTSPPYTDAVQPIRNSELANLALDILNLPPVPGSTLNPMQDLSIAALRPNRRGIGRKGVEAE